jgi:hypothetical protein
MTQVHKRFNAEQVKMLFQGYCQGHLSRAEVEELLEIGKTRFFALLKSYRQNAEAFSIEYRRSSKGRLSPEAEKLVEQELLRDKALIEDKDVICLRVTRTLDGYRRISLDRHQIEVPKVEVREDVDLHLVPDMEKNILEVRIWAKGKMVHSVNLPLAEFRRFS